MFNIKRWLQICLLYIERRYLMMRIDFLEQDILNWMRKHSARHLSTVSVRPDDKYLSEIEIKIIELGKRCDEIQAQLNALGYFSYK